MIKILIADDSRLVLSLIKNILEKENQGYTIITANDGKEAYDKVIHELPDLILLDWHMPVKDGMETLIAIKRNNKTKNIPVIMLTGSDNLEEAYDNGAIEFIKKPFERVEIIARIHSVLKAYTGNYKNLELLKK